MTIRHLDTLFAPRSVAVFGATERAGSIGSVLMQNIVGGGYAGAIWPVNPGREQVHGLPCFGSVAALPEAPELAIIATPFAAAAGLVGELGARGTHAAIVIGAPTGDPVAVRAQRQALLDATRPHCLRLIGPNSLGLMGPRARLNASFAHLPAAEGRLAFVAQSGAIVTAMIDWASSRSIGFSHVVSLGDMADVDFGDMLDFLANDAGTDAILLYVESVTSARKFVSAARAAARMKPVLVVKGGRSAAGARAAATHTGALLGRDAVYDAVFRRTGMVRVGTLLELFAAAETLGRGRRISGERLAIVTNGGGMAVLAADALESGGGALAPLAPQTLDALDTLLPAGWSRGNPVDIVGDGDAGRLVRAVQTVAADPGIDTVLVIHCPTAVNPSVPAAERLVAALEGTRGAQLMSCWVGGGAEVVRAREILAAARVFGYPSPEVAVRAFLHALAYQRGQQTLMQTPAPAPELRTAAAAGVPALVEAALAAGREWLDTAEVRTVLGAYGFELLPSASVESPAQAAAAAVRVGLPVALKIRSPDIPHKTEVGGVVLELAGAAAVQAAAEAMLERVRAARPQARIEGFVVEPMLDRHAGHELLLGMSCDPQFGPVLAFGHGGTAVEAIDDRALALPPLNRPLARAMIAETRVARLLRGARGLPAADAERLELALLGLSELVCDLPGVAEVDINPLLACPDRAVVLDARIRIARPPAPGTARLAIKPYPQELEEDVVLEDGRRLWLRPVRPEDEPALARTFGTLTREEVYLRFFAPLKALSHAMAARFTQIDYDRQMVLVLTEHGPPGETPYHGSVNITCDPDMQHAEYAILVHHEFAGLGLGQLLMERMIAYARRRGIRSIDGEVLAQNAPMLGLCRKLGFRLRHDPRDPSVVNVSLEL